MSALHARAAFALCEEIYLRGAAGNACRDEAGEAEPGCMRTPLHRYSRFGYPMLYVVRDVVGHVYRMCSSCASVERDKAWIYGLHESTGVIVESGQIEHEEPVECECCGERIGGEP